MSTCEAGEGKRASRRPFYRTGNVIEGDFPGLPSIQVGPSHCDERAADTGPIVGQDLRDVWNLTDEQHRHEKLEEM